MSNVVCYENCKVLLPEARWGEHLFVQDGKIVEKAHSFTRVDLLGAYVFPGFIDIQVNGGFGVDLSLEPEKLSLLSNKITQTGITSFLATLISLPLSHYVPTLETLYKSEKKSGATCLGVHLEGPHFARTKKGAHDAQSIVEKCENTFWQNLFSLPESSFIKMVTLAPENEGALSLIEFLAKKGVIVSCGHSEASYEDMQKAYEKGLSFVTHLFNAMKRFDHREPGPIGFVLGDKKVGYSLIADGHHVHKAACRLAYNSFPEGMIVTGDASSALGMPDGCYSLGKNLIEVVGDRATLKGEKTLAGGVMPMNRMVQKCIEMTGCSLHQAVASVTERPAKLLGLEAKKGSLLPSFDADFCVVDPESFNVQDTFVQGMSCKVEPISDA